MSDDTKFIKGLFSKIDSDLYAIEEECLLKVESLEKELEQNKAITEAAKFLVKVKRHKDTQPAQYQASMPIAWRKLEEALKNHGELEGL